MSKNCNCNYKTFGTLIPSLREGIFPECLPPKNMIYIYKRENGKFYYYDHFGVERAFEGFTLENLNLKVQGTTLTTYDGSETLDFDVTRDDLEVYSIDEVNNLLDSKAPIVPKEYIDPRLNFASTTTRYLFGADSPLYTVIDLGVFQNLTTINAYNEGGPRIYEHNILLLNSSSDTRTLEYIRIIAPDGSPIPPNNTSVISVNPNERRILKISAFGGYVTASQITV